MPSCAASPGSWAATGASAQTAATWRPIIIPAATAAAPSCQAVQKEIWVDRRRAEVIDAPYFHVVFTLPHELNPLIFANQKTLYGLFHRCCAETLLELCADKRYLGHSPASSRCSIPGTRRCSTMSICTASSPAALPRTAGSAGTAAGSSCLSLSCGASSKGSTLPSWTGSIRTAPLTSRAPA